MLSENLITIMEYLGTIAFAISGSLVAISCSLDLFGVIIVGCVTAVGGGMVRDLLIGNTPPQIFSNPLILLLALAISLIVFIIAYINTKKVHINTKKFKGLREKIDNINNFFDALGLAVFSVSGIEVACVAGFSDNWILVITLGVITGVGGGVLRDIFVNKKTYILTKHIYAVASIIGCGLYYLLGVYFDYKAAGTFAAVVLTVLIRLLAARFRWELPKVIFEDEK